MSIKYIFCVSTGRCGTDYLKTLLSQLEKVTAYHEQKPLLHNKLMRQYLNGIKEPVQQKMPRKISILKKNGAKIYIDTTHIFIKSFGWELPKDIPQEEIGVIFLKRSKQAVVNSTHRVHSGPFTYLGRKWILVPYKNSILKPPINRLLYQTYRYILKVYWMVLGESQSTVKTYPRFFERTSKELIGWYYDETYALGEKFLQTFPNVTYIEVTLDELNSIAGVEKIVAVFRLTEHYKREKMEPFIGKARNLKKEFKE